MKFNINTKELLDALSIIGIGVKSSKPEQESFAYIQFTGSSEKGLTLKSANGCIATSTHLEVDYTGDKVVLNIEYSKLNNLIRSLRGSQELTFEVYSDKLIISNGIGGMFTLKNAEIIFHYCELNPDEYNSVVFETQALKENLDLVLATSNISKPSSPEQNSIDFRFSGGLVLTKYNHSTLSFTSVIPTVQGECDRNYVIDLGLLRGVSKLLKDGVEYVTYSYSEDSSLVKFTVGDTDLIGYTFNTEPVNYKPLVNRVLKDSVEISMNRIELTTALSSLSTLTSTGTVELEVSENQLSVTDPKTNSSYTLTIECESELPKVYVDSNLLGRLIGNCTVGESIQFQYPSNRLSPVVVSSENISHLLAVQDPS